MTLGDMITAIFPSKKDIVTGDVLVVDGTDEYGNYAGDAESPPFVIFNITQQKNLPGYYPARAEAEKALEKLKGEAA
jgi:hypothetical protein